jgi:hypothetical protein
MAVGYPSDETLPMEACAAIEQALAGHQPFGDASYILGHLQDRLIESINELASKLPAAQDLRDAVHRHPGDYRALLAETTLRSAITHARHPPASDRSGKLPVTDCAAVLTTAARYVEQGGTDTALQDGSLVKLGPMAHHGWIWRDEHGDDAPGRAFRHLVLGLYGTAPCTPDAAGIERLQDGARLLEELLPWVAPTALQHARVVALVPPSGIFTGVQSSSQLGLGGVFFLRESLGTPWWIAEHLLHESLHLKLYDLHHGHPLVRSNLTVDEVFPVITPWNPPRRSGANRWYVWRILVAFHVYVHLSLLSTLAERRAPELQATYGPQSEMLASRQARARARYLGHQLHTGCWHALEPGGQALVDWLHSVLDTLDPDPAPEGATALLYLDLYHRETEQVRQTLAGQPTASHDDLADLARDDLASTRTILRNMDAQRELARLEAGVAQNTEPELAQRYPQMRRIIESCLLAAAADSYRLSASTEHDAEIGEMVEHASDALHALTNPIPAPAAHPER